MCNLELSPAAPACPRVSLARVFVVVLAAALPAAFGQAIPPAPPASEPAAAIVLSPFTVTSDADVGYQAGNTLAGSRLNTKLSETPASVSVFTEEFLKDLGATNLAQVLEYGVNTNADFNAITTAPSFFFFDSGLLNDVRVNNRGLGASRTVDFLETSLPTDTYNTGRFEVSSGPNSVLFGFGSAAGIVNAQTRLAEFPRTFARFTATAGSWNAYRIETDINTVVLKDRFALRVLAVHDEADTWRRYAERKTDRWSFVTAIKPFKTMTLHALHERGELSLPSDRPYNRQDALSFWLRQGRQVVDNTSFGVGTGTVQNALGIRGVGIRNIFVANDSRSIFTRADSENTVIYQSASIYEPGVSSGIAPQRLDTGPYVTLLPTEPRRDGVPHAPYDINYYGPDRRRENRISRTFVRLEQRLGREGFIELAFNEDKGRGFSHQLTGSFTLYGDPNQFLPNPDGSQTRVPNPNAGKLYVEQVNYHNVEDTVNRVMRATASWKLDLGRWWGEHRLAGMADRSTNHGRSSQGPEILVNSATGIPILNAAAPENPQNYLYRRNYVTAGAPETYVPAPRRDAVETITFGGVNYTPRLVSVGNFGSERQIDSLMAATQSRFWSGRLILTGGIRRDDVDITPLLTARLAATDPRVVSRERVANELEYLGPDRVGARSYSFNTYTAGAVFQATRWLAAFYNESNNNGTPQTVRRILPDVTFPPPPEGFGRDYGAMFNFLDGRFFARATAYNTTSKNDPTIRDNAFINAHRRIINAFRDAGRIDQAEADLRNIPGYPGDFLSDLDTRGYELEVKANPTKNWTLTASYSYTKFKRSNLGQEWFPWFAAQKAYYARHPSDLLTTANIPISTEVAQIETGVDNLFALNALGYNNRPHKANAFTRYSFSEGRLKGWFVGGGVRWQDKNVLQREITGFDALGKDVLGRILYGPEIFNVDGLLGWSARLKSGPLGHGTTVRAQLNVSNLLGNDDAQIVRFNRVGDGYWRVVSREPRAYRFSVSLGF